MSADDERAASLRQAYAHCGALAREGERDRWLSALFAPEAARPHLHALAAFEYETGRIRVVTHEPLAGEMRLAWWREAIEGSREGEAAAHPVAAALIDTLGKSALSKSAFDDLLHTRAFDLYDDAMPTLDDLEAYCQQTDRTLFQAAALILGEGRDLGVDEASEAAGLAMGLTRALRVFRDPGGRPLYLPRDLLERHGVPVEEARARREGPGLRAALAELRALAERRLLDAEQALARAPEAVAPAFVPLGVVRLDLRSLARRESLPFAPLAPTPVWRRQWALWRWARGRRGA